MISAMIRRVGAFAALTLTEYARSGRVLIELLVVVAAFAIFFRQTGPEPMSADYFFGTAGVLTVLLALYTNTAVLGLGDRPQGYVVLARRLGRAGYLLGLYLAALAVGAVAFGVLSLLVALLHPVAALTVGGWLAGALPLVLNIALVGALLTLLTPLVLPPRGRLIALAAFVGALSGSLIGGEMLRSFPDAIATLLNVVRTLLSTPLLPAFSGYALAVSRDYNGFGIVIPLAQLTLTMSLLTLAVYAFSRREIIFSA